MCLKAMGLCKAVGEDGIPVEVYRASPAAREALFAFVKRCWREEEVPGTLVRGTFVPLWKHKGS